MRQHVGPLLAQYEPSCTVKYRERMTDTMLLCRGNERLGVHYLSDYSPLHCNYSTLRMTNQPAYIAVVVHRTFGMVEPRCNTIKGGQWKYRYKQAGLVSGFYWQYDCDDDQLLNSTDVLRAAAASRHGWYKAIEIDEQNIDKTTRSYQETLRDQSPIDNWPRRHSEFVLDNIGLWSRYLQRHDNSAESIVCVPSQLPSSEAYKRCTRQRTTRHCG